MQESISMTSAAEKMNLETESSKLMMFSMWWKYL